MLSEATNTALYVERILRSAEFSRSARMAQFLRYIIAKTESGEHEELKEKIVGIAVFGRSHDWDPKLDTIVRSEARRLRAKLEEYYNGAGKEDVLRLTVPKGSYVPEWCVREEVRIAVEPQPAPLPAVESAPEALQGRRWTKWPLYAGFAVILCALSFWLLRPAILGTKSTLADEGAEFEVLPFATEAGRQFNPAISPDGKKVAFVWDGGKSNFDIYIKQVKSGALKRVTDDKSPDLHPAWSPDGRQLAYLRRSASASDLMLLDVEGGRPHKVASISSLAEGWVSESLYSGCQSPTWSPDGKSMVLTQNLYGKQGYGLVYVPVNSGPIERITTPASGDEDCYPRFSPDGQTLAFIRYISHGRSDIYTLTKESKQVKQLTFDHRNVRGLSWTADGKRIIFASNRQGSYEIQMIGREGGRSQSLPSNTASASEPVVSPDGHWLAFVESAENWNIWRARLDAAGMVRSPERFIASSGKNHTPSISPDGSTIAFVSDRSGNPEIWISDSDGKQARQLTQFGGPWLGTIRWSPDSSKIVFDARPKGHSAIFTLPVSGGTPRVIEEGPFEVRRPAWSRDGKSIYFDIHRVGKSQIYKLALEDGSSRPIAPSDSLDPTESIDGRLLFFISSLRQLWRSGSDGSNAEVIPGVRPNPELDWAVVTDGIYFASDADAATTINFFRFVDHKVIRAGLLPQALSPGTPSLVISSDRKWLLYVTTDYIKSDIKLRKML